MKSQKAIKRPIIKNSDYAVSLPLGTIKNILRNEIKDADRAFDKHIRKNGCRSDMAGCWVRAHYQSRVLTLNLLLRKFGGRVPEYYNESDKNPE
jgi:hypothetical protein